MYLHSSSKKSFYGSFKISIKQEIEMKKSIMIIGAGLLQLPAIEIARKMGLRTIVTDYDENV